MKIVNNTKTLFIQEPEYVIDYYHRRKLYCSSLEHFITNTTFGLLDDAEFSVGKSLYAISHFLGKADTPGYDIVKVNDLLHLKSSDGVAIALLLGDDVLCVNVETGQLFVWLCETGNGEKLNLSDNMESFLAKLKV